MSIARWAPAIGATAVVAAMLAGCTPPPEPPRPATAEEIQALRDERAREGWDTVADGAPMPVVEVIEELPPEEAYERQLQCMEDAAIPGVSVVEGGGLTWPEDEDVSRVVEQQYWICSQQYPAAGDDKYVLSQSELEWLYDFFERRYRPCLGSLGFELVDFPQHERFVGDTAGFPAWIPYDRSVSPPPSPNQWTLIAERCPLPSMLGVYELPGYTTSG